MPSLKFKNPTTGEWQKVNVGGSYDANLAAHVNNKNNPHAVTPEQIGAAPSGYGLGKATLLKPEDNLDTLRRNGWYYINTVNPPLGTLPTDINPEAYCIRIWTSNGMGCIQEAADIMVHSNNCGAILRRVIYGNTVKPWEWVNPPMRLDVEYRTTERFLGKPVYVKVLDTDALANDGIKGIRHSISDIDYAISAHACTSDGYSLPYIDENTEEVTLSFSFTRTDIHIKCVGDWRTSGCTFVLKYTKTTD